MPMSSHARDTSCLVAMSVDSGALGHVRGELVDRRVEVVARPRPG